MKSLYQVCQQTSSFLSSSPGITRSPVQPQAPNSNLHRFRQLGAHSTRLGASQSSACRATWLGCMSGHESPTLYPHVPCITSHLHWRLRTCSNPCPVPSEPSLQLSHIPITPAQSRVTSYCFKPTEEPDARSDTMGKWQPRAKFSMIRSTTSVGLFFPTNLNDFHQALIGLTTLRWTWLCQSWLSSANRLELRSGN